MRWIDSDGVHRMFEKPIIGWGQHLEDKSCTHHALVSRGSDLEPVATACSCHWSPRDSWSLFLGRDTIVFPKCIACVEYVNAERAREGLEPISGIHPRYERELVGKAES